MVLEKMWEKETEGGRERMREREEVHRESSRSNENQRSICDPCM